MTAGSHTLLIRIEPLTNQTFWFDYLRYTPFPNASFSDAVLYVPSNDVTLSSDWEPRGGIPSVDGISLAFGPKSVATFDFVGTHNPFLPASVHDKVLLGTHIAWYGWLLRFEPLKPTNSTIIIDDGEQTNFF